MPVYVAFDFDHDLELKQALIAQARHPDSPVEVADCFLKEAAPEKDWKDKARVKIRRVKKVIVIVGVHTHRAPGVRAEVQIAGEELRDPGAPGSGMPAARVGHGRRPRVDVAEPQAAD